MSELNISDSSERKVKCISNEDMGGMMILGYNSPLLTVGKTYTMIDVEAHDWHTLVTLKEFPEVRFNSVSFSEIDRKSAKEPHEFKMRGEI